MKAFTGKSVLIIFGLLLVMLGLLGEKSIVVEARPYPQTQMNWLFPSSSLNNADLANSNYPGSTVERWVAKGFGDEFPAMRDDLIRRKNEGEGFWSRHYNTWADPSTWSYDRNNDQYEALNPYIYTPSETFHSALDK